jgi:MFS family permease
MPAIYARARHSACAAPAAWIPAAAVLFGTGWGSNQFTPMLLVYRQTLGLGAGTLEAMFGFYALGLIPGLLVAGPVSDAYGRRRVVVPAAALSLAASLILVAGAQNAPLLFFGRLLAGLSNGAAFASGTAWLRECSRPPLGNADDQTAAKRAAVAMTNGFALGPLAAGLLGQWAGAPRVVPYLPHIALMAGVLVLLRSAPETGAPGSGAAVWRMPWPAIRSGRFRALVAPMAPWVFAAPAIAFALLPSVAGVGRATDGIALTAAITAFCALSGVSVQPLARRLGTRSQANWAGVTGLLVLAGGLVLAVVTVQSHQAWLLVPCSIVFGSAYGLCLVSGLVEVQRLAGPSTLAGLTAVYCALTYTGFAAPYLLALAAPMASYAILLSVTAVLALTTAAFIGRRSASARGLPAIADVAVTESRADGRRSTA